MNTSFGCSMSPTSGRFSNSSDSSHSRKLEYSRGLRIKRSEEHTSELQSLMRISYAVFCLKKKKQQSTTPHQKNNNTTNKKTRANLSDTPNERHSTQSTR